MELEMVQDARFDPSELGTTKVQRLECALLREYWINFQDLKMYLLWIRQVAEEIFSDPALNGELILTFTPTFDESEIRTFRSAMVVYGLNSLWELWLKGKMFSLRWSYHWCHLFES